MTRGLLGLSVACARCHDHKFDPIPTDDYYSLYGVFASSEEPEELPLLRLPGGDEGARRTIEASSPSGRRPSRRSPPRRSGPSSRRSCGPGSPTTSSRPRPLDFNARSPKLDEVREGAKLRPDVLRRLIVRWRERTRRRTTRVLPPGRRFAALPAGEFQAKSAAAIAAAIRARRPASPLAAHWSRGRLATPPAPRPRSPQRYGDVLAQALADPPDQELDRPPPAGSTSPTRRSPIADRDLRRLLNQDERNRLAMLERKVYAARRGPPGRPGPRDGDGRQAEPGRATRLPPRQPRPARQGRCPAGSSRSSRPPERPKPSSRAAAGSNWPRRSSAKDNPLTARVMVNRIWMNHFGQGIVRHAQRLRPPRRPAHAPRTARLARGRRSSRGAGRSRRCTG